MRPRTSDIRVVYKRRNLHERDARPNAVQTGHALQQRVGVERIDLVAFKAFESRPAVTAGDGLHASVAMPAAGRIHGWPPFASQRSVGTKVPGPR